MLPVNSIDEINALCPEGKTYMDEGCEFAAHLYAAWVAGGTTVYYTGVLSDTAAEYARAMDFLERFTEPYSVVPVITSALEEEAYVACVQACLTAAERAESAANTESELNAKYRRVVWAGVYSPVNAYNATTAYQAGDRVTFAEPSTMVGFYQCIKDNTPEGATARV